MAKALSLACEACRKRKAKCSGAPGPCSKCVQAQLVCIFPTAVKARRTPVRSSRRIDELDDRLRRIEALLKDIFDSKSFSASRLSPPHVELAEKTRSSDSADSLPTPSEHNGAVLRTVRLQSGLSTFTKDRDVAAGSGEEFAGSHSASTTRSHGLSLPEAEDLLNHYFASTNQVMPLFEQSVVRTILQDCYSGSASSISTAQSAALNAIFALSHQSKAMQTADDGIDHQSETLHHIGNAMAAVGELAMASPSILIIQTLLGMARVWQSTSMPQNANMILAMAIRQIHQLGLHKQRGSDVNTDADEWRRRLLWIAYTLDKDYSLRSDQPHALDDRETDFTLLPRWIPQDGLGFLLPNTGEPSISYFRLSINLSIIQSKIHARLQQIQSTSSQPQDLQTPPTESICDLISLLQTWKQQIHGVTFQPVPLLQNFSQQSIIALTTLYLRYFNCMALIHRRSYWHVGHLEAYKLSHEEAVTNHCPSHRMCYVAARVSLQLFTVLPQGDVPCIWLLIDHFVSAALILLTGIIYESSLNTGWEDFQLVEPVIANLAVCAQKGDRERLSFIHANCLELQHAARTMLEQTEARGWGAAPEKSHKALSPTEYDWLYPNNQP